MPLQGEEGRSEKSKLDLKGKGLEALRKFGGKQVRVNTLTHHTSDKKYYLERARYIVMNLEQILKEKYGLDIAIDPLSPLGILITDLYYLLYDPFETPASSPPNDVLKPIHKFLVSIFTDKRFKELRKSTVRNENNSYFAVAQFFSAFIDNLDSPTAENIARLAERLPLEELESQEIVEREISEAMDKLEDALKNLDEKLDKLVAEELSNIDDIDKKLRELENKAKDIFDKILERTPQIDSSSIEMATELADQQLKQAMKEVFGRDLPFLRNRMLQDFIEKLARHMEKPTASPSELIRSALNPQARKYASPLRQAIGELAKKMADKLGKPDKEIERKLAEDLSRAFLENIDSLEKQLGEIAKSDDIPSEKINKALDKIDRFSDKLADALKDSVRSFGLNPEEYSNELNKIAKKATEPLVDNIDKLASGNFDSIRTAEDLQATLPNMEKLSQLQNMMDKLSRELSQRRGVPKENIDDYIREVLGEKMRDALEQLAEKTLLGEQTSMRDIKRALSNALKNALDELKKTFSDDPLTRNMLDSLAKNIPQMADALSSAFQNMKKSLSKTMEESLKRELENIGKKAKETALGREIPKELSEALKKNLENLRLKPEELLGSSPEELAEKLANRIKENLPEGLRSEDELEKLRESLRNSIERAQKNIAQSLGMSPEQLRRAIENIARKTGKKKEDVARDIMDSLRESLEQLKKKLSEKSLSELSDQQIRDITNDASERFKDNLSRSLGEKASDEISEMAKQFGDNLQKQLQNLRNQQTSQGSCPRCQFPSRVPSNMSEAMQTLSSMIKKSSMVKGRTPLSPQEQQMLGDLSKMLSKMSSSLADMAKQINTKEALQNLISNLSRMFPNAIPSSVASMPEDKALPMKMASLMSALEKQLSGLKQFKTASKLERSLRLMGAKNLSLPAQTPKQLADKIFNELLTAPPKKAQQIAEKYQQMIDKLLNGINKKLSELSVEEELRPLIENELRREALQKLARGSSPEEILQDINERKIRKLKEKIPYIQTTQQRQQQVYSPAQPQSEIEIPEYVPILPPPTKKKSEPSLPKEIDKQTLRELEKERKKLFRELEKQEKRIKSKLKALKERKKIRTESKEKQKETLKDIFERAKKNIARIFEEMEKRKDRILSEVLDTQKKLEMLSGAGWSPVGHNAFRLGEKIKSLFITDFAEDVLRFQSKLAQLEKGKVKVEKRGTEPFMFGITRNISQADLIDVGMAVSTGTEIIKMNEGFRKTYFKRPKSRGALLLAVDMSGSMNDRPSLSPRDLKNIPPELRNKPLKTIWARSVAIALLKKYKKYISEFLGGLYDDHLTLSGDLNLSLQERINKFIEDTLTLDSGGGTNLMNSLATFIQRIIALRGIKSEAELRRYVQRRLKRIPLKERKGLKADDVVARLKDILGNVEKLKVFFKENKKLKSIPQSAKIDVVAITDGLDASPKPYLDEIKLLKKLFNFDITVIFIGDKKILDSYPFYKDLGLTMIVEPKFLNETTALRVVRLLETKKKKEAEKG